MTTPISQQKKLELEKIFPKLQADGWDKTSEPDRAYNCIAWGNRDTNKNWQPTPIPIPGYYWPEGAIKSMTPEALVSAYTKNGFEKCENGGLEAGYEKLALYVGSTGDWTHAARQLPSGKWTSKLGGEEDIEHTTPEGLESDAYGKVFGYMKRAIKVRPKIDDET